jgi:hypothetical protein
MIGAYSRAKTASVFCGKPGQTQMRLRKWMPYVNGGTVHDKLHVHWRLATLAKIPIDNDFLRECRKLATRLVAGDATNIPALHSARWPGSWHQKAAPRLAHHRVQSGRRDRQAPCAGPAARLRRATARSAWLPRARSAASIWDPIRNSQAAKTREHLGDEMERIESSTQSTINFAPQDRAAQRVPTSDAITVVRASGRRLAKLVNPDGHIDHYDETKHVDLIEQPLADLADLLRLLKRLAARPDCAVVRAAIADRRRVHRVRRPLYPDRKTGDAATLVDRHHHWLAIDIDNLARPSALPADILAGCAELAIATLPAAFHHASSIVQATASHGLKPGIRLRLWFGC